MADKRVRTRFAPSPTGYLHIGGLRTALFNWFYAKSNGGDFILRIEDTDRERYILEALHDIINSMKWFGITYDEGPEVGGDKGPYFQSERLDIYDKYVKQLIDEGKAYYCYCSKERLDWIRGQAQRDKRPPKYDRRCRHLTEEERKEFESQGIKPVVRFKMPEEDGEIKIKDYLRGIISFSHDSQDDFIIMKTDGYPTYHLANIVDDHHMEISHVLRGEEWIPSLARHAELYRAFGWEAPVFVHLPVILDPTGGKLSKRKTINLGGQEQEVIVTVKEFIERGYLKEALVNFLAFLGWGYDDKTEFMSISELCSKFDIAKIGKASPTFHFDKLDYYNGSYIRMKSDEDLAELCRGSMVKAGILPEKDCPKELDEYYKSQIPLIKERLKFIEETPSQLQFFYKDEIEYKDKKDLVPKKSNLETTIMALEKSLEVLSEISDFDIKVIESVLRDAAVSLEIKVGQLFMPIRIALTGSTVSPGLFETIHVLGKDRTVKRLNGAINFLKG